MVTVSRPKSVSHILYGFIAGTVSFPGKKPEFHFPTATSEWQKNLKTMSTFNSLAADVWRASYKTESNKHIGNHTKRLVRWNCWGNM